ncbi:MAG: molybdopterin-dependent oxidoreductase [Chloroflexota bacterium]
MFDISRRVFLELLGAATAGATMASGKLSDAADAAVRLVRPRPWYEHTGNIQKTYSYCDMCLWKCGIVVSTVNGKVVKIDGNPADPKSNGRLCARGNAGVASLYDPDRLKKPLIRVAGSERGDGRYQEASWQAALDYSAERLLAVKQQWGGPEAVAFFGHGTADGWFAEYLPQAFGSPNTAKPSVSVCVGPREVAATLTYGRAFGGHEPVDWDEANYIVLIGNHIGENAHNTPMQQLADARARGAKLVVVDPRFSSVAMKADTWLPIKPATDTALILAWINVLITEKLYDWQFVEQYTQGFGQLADAIRENTPEWAAQITELSPDTIRAVARGLAEAKPRAVVVPSRHVAWYGNDTQRNRAIFILNALLGSPGRHGGFWFQKAPWIEEYPHPAFGATADAGGCSAPGDAGGAAEPEAAHETRPRADGGDGIKFMTGSVAIQELIEPMVSGSPYPIKGLVNYGMNLFHSIPNVERTKQAVRNLDFYMAIDVLPMDHVMWADVILPEATYLERYDDLLAQAHKQPYIALREPAVAPLYDTKPGWWIAKELGTRMGLGAYFPWENIEEYLDYRLHTVGSSLQGIREAGGVLIQKGQPYIEDLEAAKKPAFPTPSGKILLYNEKLKAAGHDPVPRYQPVPEPPAGMFRLTYGRAPMHTFGKTQNNALLTKVMAENELWLNSEAAKQLGLTNGQYVEMENQDGVVSAPIRLKVTERIRPDLVYMVHGFGHQAPGLRRANGKGASDTSMQTRYVLDKISGGAGMRVNFVSIRPAPDQPAQASHGRPAAAGRSRKEVPA